MKCRCSMRFFSAALFILFVFASGCSLPFHRDDSSPRVIDLKGNSQSLGSYYGSYTLLFLWASWCPECILELGNLNTVAQKLKGHGVKILAVAVSDDLEAVRTSPPVRQAAFPVLVDVKDTIKERYPVNSLPTTYLLNATGNAIPLYDPEDNKAKKPVMGFREWQSDHGIESIIKSIVR